MCVQPTLGSNSILLLHYIIYTRDEPSVVLLVDSWRVTSQMFRNYSSNLICFSSNWFLPLQILFFLLWLLPGFTFITAHLKELYMYLSSKQQDNSDQVLSMKWCEKDHMGRENSWVFYCAVVHFRYVPQCKPWQIWRNYSQLQKIVWWWDSYWKCLEINQIKIK